MAKIEITKTELVWPGKYNEDGTRKEVPRVNLPFQVIETINETRATREAAKKPKQSSLFDVWQAKEGDTFEEGWKNKLIWGDNKLVMSSLLEKFAGKIDLIYIDPPFATGADFSFVTEIGEGGLEVAKDQSIIEEKAYRDTWGKGIDSYLHMMYERLLFMKDILAEYGSLYVHCDFRVNSHFRFLMDSIFGEKNYNNEIIWNYATGGASREYYAQKHDNILFYSNTPKYKFYPERVREARTEKAMKRAQTPKGARISVEDETKLPTDVWQIPALNPMAVERLGFPTQKPEELLSKIILASSDENDLIADFFCGSGTTMAVAEKLGRRWIGCDLSRWAIHVTRKRLLGIENCKPFEVLNLGKYERKYWQGVTFGDKKKTDLQLAIYQYLAFILKLYGAEPLAGMQHLHGKKGKAVVHVGAVDAPVTIDEINSCALFLNCQ